ncbi:MAG: HDOD domain-containing protein [Candidatus Magnetoovum sp. WYHC-5]|nr:HDOD domain-containing protein [Candidatus Magnetoovum sp. WYHC-5]
MSYKSVAFEGLTERDISAVYSAGKLINFKRDEVLIKEGDIGDIMYFIVYGTVNVVRTLGGKQQHLATLNSGDFVGEISLIKQVKRTASVIATTPTTCLCIDKQGMETLPANIQLTIFKNLNTVISQRISKSFDKEVDYQKQNAQLTTYILNDYQSKTKSYSESEFLDAVIQKLPKLPTYTTKLTNMLLDDKASAKDVISIVSEDPILVGLVLKSVNSPFYNLNCKVSDFSHAVLFLGFNHIYQLLIDSGIKKIMPNKSYCQDLYYHSNAISFICYEIAMLTQMSKPVLMSTIGILHDIGKYVIFMLRLNYPKLDVLIDGLYHAKIGSIVLKQWSIPENVYQIIEYQDYCDFASPKEVPETCKEGVAVLHIAHICYNYITIKNVDENSLYSVFSNDFLDILNIQEKTALDFVIKRVLPSMARKLDTFPENIRQLISAYGGDF